MAKNDVRMFIYGIWRCEWIWDGVQRTMEAHFIHTVLNLSEYQTHADVVHVYYFSYILPIDYFRLADFCWS